MGKKKSKAPGPTANERASAEIAEKEHAFVKKYVRPVILQQKADAQAVNFSGIFGSRMNADMMQKTQQTGAGKYAITTSAGGASVLGKGLAKGIMNAEKNAKELKSKDQIRALASGRQLAAGAITSLRDAAKIDSNIALSGYMAEQKRRAEQVSIVMDGAKSLAGSYGTYKARQAFATEPPSGNSMAGQNAKARGFGDGSTGRGMPDLSDQSGFDVTGMGQDPFLLK